MLDNYNNNYYVKLTTNTGDSSSSSDDTLYKSLLGTEKLTYLEKYFIYNYWANFALATFLSAMKLAYGAGKVLFALQALVEQYPDVFNNADGLDRALYGTGILINICVTLATRINPMYNALLPAKFYVLNKDITNENLEIPERISSGYLIFQDDVTSIDLEQKTENKSLIESKHKIHEINGPGTYEAKKFDPEVDINIENFYERLVKKYSVSQTSHSLSPELNKLFYEIKKYSTPRQPYENTFTEIVYRCNMVLCYLSILVGAISAYIFGIKLAEYLTIPMEGQPIFALFVTVGSSYSYYNFNLAKGIKGVKEFCDSIDSFLTTGDANLSITPMSLTLPIALIGTMYGTGMSFLSTERSISTLSEQLHFGLEQNTITILVAIALVINLSDQLFGFSNAVLKLLTDWLQPKSTEKTAQKANCCSTKIILTILSCLVFFDALLNSFGGFIGCEQLLNNITGPKAKSDYQGYALLSSIILGLGVFEFKLHKNLLTKLIIAGLTSVIIGVGLPQVFPATSYIVKLAEQPNVFNTTLSAFIMVVNTVLLFAFSITSTDKAATFLSEKIISASQSCFFTSANEETTTADCKPPIYKPI